MTRTDSNIRKSYKLYKSTVKEPVDIKTYIKIANDYNKFLMERVLDGEEVTLPANMGIISILGSKQKITFDENGFPNLPIDWVKTQELRQTNEKAKSEKKVIYLLNEHTNGVRYKLHWSKRRTLIENKTIYSFRLTRTNKRLINKAIKEGKEFLIKS